MDNEVIDYDTISELLSFCKPADIAELVVTFLELAPERLQEIRDGVVAGHAETVSSSVHSMRSGIGSLGLVAMAPLAAALEESAVRGDVEGLAGLMEALETEYARVEPLLKAICAEPELLTRLDN